MQLPPKDLPLNAQGKRIKIHQLSPWLIALGMVLYVVAGELLKELLIFQWLEPYLLAKFSVEQAEFRAELGEYLMLSALLIPTILLFVVLPSKRVNLTLRNLYQESLARAEELQQKIEENEHLQKQLLHAQKIQALGTLAGGIAHDFNNILASMIGNTELVMEDLPADSPVQEKLNRIMKGGMRAEDLVRQILTFSRMEISQKVPIDLAREVRGAAEIIEVTVPANIKFKVDTPDSVPAVLGDPTQIHQILINLCKNSVQAIENQQGEITVNVEAIFPVPDHLFAGRHPRPKACIEWTIRDNGSGIAPADLERIFDPFFTTKDVGKGTGLGLSVVHGIVENHYGEIAIESELGIGTTLSIFFPVADGTPESENENKLPDKKCKGRLLIVEDEPELLKVYQEFLGKRGFEVTECSDGSQALQTFRDNPDAFDLVLTDQAMPGINGKQLVLQILKIKPDLPIIMSTGYSELVSETEALRLGVRRFLFKPLRLRELIAVIEDCLNPNE